MIEHESIDDNIDAARRGTVMRVFYDLSVLVTIGHASIDVMIFFPRQKRVTRVLHSPRTSQILDLGITFN